MAAVVVQEGFADAKGRAETSEAEVARLVPELARVTRAASEAAAAAEEARLVAAEDTRRTVETLTVSAAKERSRAKVAERALKEANEELREWRAGNVRVATYSKWKERFDERHELRDELEPEAPLSPWQADAEGATNVAISTGALKRSSDAGLEVVSYVTTGSVSTVELSLGAVH